MGSPTLFLTRSKTAVFQLLNILKGLYSPDDRPVAVEILYRRIMRLFPDDIRTKHGTLSMWWSVENLKRNGLKPGTVVDVGAFEGSWTAKVKPIFDDSDFVMIEAQPGQKDKLQTLASKLSKTRFVSCLLGAEEGREMPFYVMDTGSSVYEERTDFPRTTITLCTRTLDGVLESCGLMGPYFLKLDVQGAELDILRGSTKTLAQTEAVLLETSLLPYNTGAPLFNEVVRFMEDIGFVAYDVCGMLRRASDRAIFQLDFIFVRENSALREQKAFW